MVRAEKRAKKSLLSNAFRKFDPRLAAELKEQRKPILIGLVCTGVAALASSVFSILLIKYGQDAVTDLFASTVPGQTKALELREAGFHMLVFCCVSVMLLYGLQYWFVRGQTYYLNLASNRLAANLRTRLLFKLMKLPVGYYNDRRAGAIQSVLTNDVNVYQNAVGIIRDSVGSPITAVGAFGMIVYLQWQIALFALLLVPVMGYIIQRNSRRMKREQAKVQANLSELSATTLEFLNGVRVVKAFGAEKSISETYRQLVNKTFESQMTATHVTASLRPMTDLVGACALSIAFYMCGVLTMHHSLTPGTVLSIAFGLDRVNQGFRSFGNISNTYATVEAASDRIYSEVIEVPEDHEIGGGRTLEQSEGRITFEDVSFRYPDGTQALCGVSFVIEPGTSLALVGPSGAGKSTIADLLLRFYDPTEGRILFDGVDIRELDIAWLRSHIGVVPQHTFLFAGSVGENVRLGLPEASDEELDEALEQAHATEFVKELNARTTSVLGERGVRLSGGQMQRIAIARALIRKPTVLLLDEATSALDATSEKAVTEALDVVMKSRTTLFIAHRLTTAARADRILVLSRGEVVEVGSHTELLEQNGVYAGLFRAFSGGILA